MDALSEVEQLRRALALAEQRAGEAQKQRDEAQEQRDEAQEQRDKAQEQRDKAQKQRNEARRRADEAEQQREEAQRQLRPTTLAEYIEWCHKFLFANFTLQPDRTLTSKGSITNPQNKWCPTRLRPWSDFLHQQNEVLGRLYSVYPPQSRDFRNLASLQGLGEIIQGILVGNEDALRTIQYLVIEDPVASIVKQLRIKRLGDEFNLGGGITFENTPNIASDLADEPRERLMNFPNTPARRSAGVNLNQLRIDRICVYRNDEDDPSQRRATFVIEYKAPHKLTLPHLRIGLREMDIYAEVVNRVTKPPTTDPEALFQYTSDRLAAAAIAQTYHYMIEGGLEYSYLTTGQAFVFLKIDWESPEVLYFHLAEPSEEVKAHPENFCHCTAVSQVLAFSLLSFASAAHGQDERCRATAMLNTWNVDYESILRAIPESERKQTPTSSGFEPRTYKHFDRSPYLLRKGKKQNPSDCRAESSRSNDMQSPATSDDEPGVPDTPTRPRLPIQTKGTRRPQGEGSASGSTTTGNQSRPYCTQGCLLGLAKGGPLDENCPNLSIHCGGRYQACQLHSVSLDTWLHLMREQLARTLDKNIEPLWIQGARGIMFKVTLASYGYTVIAKGTVLAFLEDLKREAAVYKRLRRLQGTYVPIFLGSVDLEHPYYYDFQVRVIHMIFLSWSGDRIDSGCLAEDERLSRSQELVRSVRAMHMQGVLHSDIRAANVLWNAEVRRAMLIDFERADIVDPARAPLLPTSPNLKRKRSFGKGIIQVPNNWENQLGKMREEESAATLILHRASASTLC